MYTSVKYRPLAGKRADVESGTLWVSHTRKSRERAHPWTLDFIKLTKGKAIKKYGFTALLCGMWRALCALYAAHTLFIRVIQIAVRNMHLTTGRKLHNPLRYPSVSAKGHQGPTTSGPFMEDPQ